MSVEFVGHDVVCMAELTYAWVRLEHFTFDVAQDDRAVLAELIASDPYAWDFATAPLPPHPLWLDRTRVHGPWLLEEITVDGFQPVSSGAAISVIDKWINENELLDSDDEQRETVRARLEPVYELLRSGSVFQLDNPSDYTTREWLYMGGTGFHEFVVIDRSSGSLHVIVASDD